MTEQPGFHTRRLLLRPRGMGDFDACLAMDRDPQVTRFIPGPWSDPARHAAFLRARIATDVHAPARFRAQTVRNLDAWYPAFDVQPGQKLFLPPEQRVKVW